MGNNFDFDDFEGFESGIDTSELGDSSSSSVESDGFAEFESTSNTENNTGGDKKGVIKTAAIAIAVSLIIVVGAFAVMKFVQSDVTTEKQVDKTTKVVDQPVKAVVEPTKKAGNTSTKSQTTQDWKEFSSSNKINFTEEYVDSIFTVVSLKNYVKVVDIESNLRVKTIVSGSLSGLIGTYELELPYTKASHLLTGNSFTVKVQLGKYDGKVVVGEIKY